MIDISDEEGKMSEVKPKRRFVVEVAGPTFIGLMAEDYDAMMVGLWFYNYRPSGTSHMRVTVGLFNPSAWLFCWELNDDEDWPDYVQYIDRKKV